MSKLEQELHHLKESNRRLVKEKVGLEKACNSLPELKSDRARLRRLRDRFINWGFDIDGDNVPISQIRILCRCPQTAVLDNGR